MKEWYKDFIGVYKNTFPKNLCNYLIDLTDKSSLNPRQTEEGGGLKKEDLSFVLENYDLNLASKIKEFLKNVIFPLYSKKYPIVNELGPIKISPLKIQKTFPSGGYHTWHCENNFLFRERVGVFTIYLNDVKEGGETEFLYQSLRIKPTQGTTTIFPASYTHTHRGNPPLSETKYIITGWIEYIDPKLLENQNSN